MCKQMKTNNANNKPGNNVEINNIRIEAQLRQMKNNTVNNNAENNVKTNNISN